MYALSRGVVASRGGVGCEEGCGDNVYALRRAERGCDVRIFNKIHTCVDPEARTHLRPVDEEADHEDVGPLEPGQAGGGGLSKGQRAGEQAGNQAGRVGRKGRRGRDRYGSR